MTTAGAMLQSCTIPYPLTIWFILPPVIVSSSYRTLNSTIQFKESLPQLRIEQLNPAKIAPFHSMNSSSTSRVSVSEVRQTDIVFPEVNPSYDREHTVNLNKEKPINTKVVAQPLKTAATSGHIRSSRPEVSIHILRPFLVYM